MKSCVTCTNCCREKGLPPIALTPPDIMRLSKKENISFNEYVSAKCQKSTRSDIPVIELIPVNGICPLQDKNQKCTAERKPCVCGSFPCGEKSWFGQPEEQTDYSNCPNADMDDMEWEQRLSFLYSDDFLWEWKRLNVIIRMSLTKAQSEKEKEYICECVYNIIYADYDTETDLYEQFQMKMLKLGVEIMKYSE